VAGKVSSAPFATVSTGRAAEAEAAEAEAAVALAATRSMDTRTGAPVWFKTQYGDRRKARDASERRTESERTSAEPEPSSGARTETTLCVTVM